MESKVHSRTTSRLPLDSVQVGNDNCNETLLASVAQVLEHHAAFVEVHLRNAPSMRVVPIDVCEWLQAMVSEAA
jgi:hypothetical protein